MGRDGEFVGEFCVDEAADASPLVFDTFASSSLGTLNATAMIFFLLLLLSKTVVYLHNLFWFAPKQTIHFEIKNDENKFVFHVQLYASDSTEI